MNTLVRIMEEIAFINAKHLKHLKEGMEFSKISCKSRMGTRPIRFKNR